MMRVLRYGSVALAVLTLVAGRQATAQGGMAKPGYHVAGTFPLGGDGGWDYIAIDTVGHRLFIGRQDRIMVVDEHTGKLLGEVPGIGGAHGVAFSQETGHGFATGGRDSTVTMFDLKTLKVLGKTHAAEDADGILYDPATKHVFTMNGDANSSSVIDVQAGKNIGTVPLGGKPEFGVSAGDGKLYANIEDSSEVVEIDAAAMKVTRRWSIKPCESPTGAAIDVAHHRLFSVCRNGQMAVSDVQAGKVVATVPIGQGVDAARFDPMTQLAFASNGGSGTITVIHEDSPDKYSVLETVQTMPGARTMEIDLKTHDLFTVSAKFGPRPEGARGRRGRPPVLPGSFALLVISR